MDRKLKCGEVVSKDGTLISKAGLITGGSSANNDARAQRWDDGAVGKLKGQREEFSSRLAALGSAAATRERSAQLAGELPGLEARLQYNLSEAQSASARASSQAASAYALEREASARQPAIDDGVKAVEARQAEVEELRARINEVADKAFAPFSKKVGVASVREWEEQHAAFEADVAKRRADLSQQESKLIAQVGYEKGRDLRKPADARAAELAKDVKRKEELEAQVALVQDGLKGLEAQMASLQGEAENHATECDKVEVDLRDARKHASKLSGEAARLAGEVSRLSASAEQAATRARDILAAGRLEGVSLPRRGSAGGGAAGLSGAGRRSRRASDDAMEVDGADGGDGGGLEEVAAELAALDFSVLRNDLRAAQDAVSREAADRELIKAAAELAAELERAAPNMKAVEQYAAVQEREREATAALDDARRDASSAASSFDGVRSARHDAFVAAFTHIAGAINGIYQELTRSAVHRLGGTAYLSLESEDAPYLNGIKYTAMPPTKRFRDMEQLSGGEKTLASLALLFAIHSYRPSPFFVLDEVDAALDATNVARVAHYIRAKVFAGPTLWRMPLLNARKEPIWRLWTRRLNAAAGSEHNGSEPFQSIVISLKDIFYEKADALVGVARDGNLGCSRTFTFDLNRFEPPADAEVS
ncbi:hypothetical protein FOA52_015427 [Chlamydomonas sp. UWO 241]|nr:hypothetical protein FOA52_015427 [Chlamydomonas sp. UWO 241]